jgi:hypothetical protein
MSAITVRSEAHEQVIDVTEQVANCDALFGANRLRITVKSL